MGNRPRELNVKALSEEEWNYIYGLYLTDGFPVVKKVKGRSWVSYEVVFGLQQDQLAIAKKLMRMLRRIGLNPHIVTSPQRKREIDVHVYSKALVVFLPNKKVLRDKAEVRERLFDERKLFTVEGGIPFIAGLIDGDGHCSVKDLRRDHMKGGIAKWIWQFKQSTLVFLADYIARFIEFLTPDGVKVRKEESRGRRRCSIVFIHKSGILALLEKGIAKYSWKVARWGRDVAKLERKVKTYYTAGEVACILSVSLRVVENLIKTGKLKYRRRQTGGEIRSKRRPWYFVSGEVVEKFLKEAERWKREKESTLEAWRQQLLLTTKETAQTLDVTKTTVIAWLKKGKMKAIALLTLGGKNEKKKYFIPIEEVKRLQAELAKKNAREKRRG